VSNRQKPTTLFGSQLDEWVETHLSIAMALYNGEADTLNTQLQSQIDELRATEPAQQLAVRFDAGGVNSNTCTAAL
jgi:hypothetical protein